MFSTAQSCMGQDSDDHLEDNDQHEVSSEDSHKLSLQKPGTG